MGLVLSAAALVIMGLRMDEAPRVAQIWPLAAGAVAISFTWVLQGVVMWLLARPMADVRLTDMVQIYLAGAFVGGVSPVRGLEIPYEVYLMRRLGIAPGAGGAMIITRGLLNSTVVVIGAVAGVFFVSGFPEVGHLSFVGLALLLAVVWGGFTWVSRRRTEVNTDNTGAGWKERIGGFLRELRDGVRRIWREQPRVLAISAAIMVVYWGVRLSVGPLALMAAGWDGSWAPVFVAQMVLVSFVLPLAPTPGGSGAAELSFAALVSPFVAGGGVLLSGVLIWRVLTHFLQLVLGAYFTGRQLSKPSSTDIT